MQRRRFLALVAALGAAPYVFAKPSPHTGVIVDERFLPHHIFPQHPESPARYQAILNVYQQQAQTWPVKRIDLDAQREVSQWLKTIHSDAHIASIQANAPVAYQQSCLATSAGLAAVDAVMSQQLKNSFVISRPPGHHATNTGREEGFCYFNHVAIMARYAQQQHNVQRVLIIDWDYHHGNGTEWAFYDDPSILCFSTHDQFAYPKTGSPAKTGAGDGEGFNINVHLDCGCTDADILRAFEDKLKPVADRFKPELILISAGFDSREDDLLGCFSITDDGFRQLTHWVKDLAAVHCQGKLVSILEGGYNIEGNASAVMTHLEALIR